MLNAGDYANISILRNRKSGMQSQGYASGTLKGVWGSGGALEPAGPCDCDICRKDPPNHTGIFLIKEIDLPEYNRLYKPVILKQHLASESDRVLICPTGRILKYLRDGKLTKTQNGKQKDAFGIAKFYVALTRAGYSVAIVCNFKNENYIDSLIKWNTLTGIQQALF